MKIDSPSRAELASSAGDGFLSLAVVGVPVPTLVNHQSMLRALVWIVPSDRRRIFGAAA